MPNEPAETRSVRALAPACVTRFTAPPGVGVASETGAGPRYTSTASTAVAGRLDRSTMPCAAEVIGTPSMSTVTWPGGAPRSDMVENAPMPPYCVTRTPAASISISSSDAIARVSRPASSTVTNAVGARRRARSSVASTLTGGSTTTGAGGVGVRDTA